MFISPDFETKLLFDLRPHLMTNPVELEKLDAHIRARCEMVRAGVQRCPSWFQEELNRLDSRLRAWWDAWNEEWVIDRLQDAGIAECLERMEAAGVVPHGEATGLLARGSYYLTLIHFSPTGRFQLDRSLIEMLRRCDTQQYSPQKWIDKKTAEAEAIEKANETKANDAVLAAVDKLSSRQIKEFIAVEEAIQNGETIIAHGETAKILERGQDEYRRLAKEAEDTGGVVTTHHDDTKLALNPGHAPHIRRK